MRFLNASAIAEQSNEDGILRTKLIPQKEDMILLSILEAMVPEKTITFVELTRPACSIHARTHHEAKW